MRVIQLTIALEVHQLQKDRSQTAAQVRREAPGRFAPGDETVRNCSCFVSAVIPSILRTLLQSLRICSNSDDADLDVVIVITTGKQSYLRTKNGLQSILMVQLKCSVDLGKAAILVAPASGRNMEAVEL